MIKFLASLLFSLFLVGTIATPLCRVDTKELKMCQPAVAPPHGQPLQPPTKGCCSVVRRADLKCLCSLKSVLPTIGINTANALALPSKCGIHTPPECRG
ncbi:putative lipid-transfer protein DIR1, partial [Cucurbita argyrosperma subsp. sororia]